MLKVLPLPFSLPIRNRPGAGSRCGSQSPALSPPLLARAAAVHPAEPPGQARQVTLANPLALIRPVDPDGRPAHYPA